MLGGAYAHPGRYPSAVCHRDAALNLAAFEIVPNGVERPVSNQTRQVVDALAAWALGATMPNFAASGDADVIRLGYDHATLLRLSALADRFDPAGVLRVGQVVRDV